MRFSSSKKSEPVREFADTMAQPSGSATDRIELANRSIGDLMAESCTLTKEQRDHIAAYQRQHGLRFGEAAVALRLATSDDVLKALSAQYEYSYTPTLLHGKDSRELIVASSPFGEEAENFRELRSHLLMGVLSEPLPRRALAVVSPDAGDGKTFVVSNLAVAFSQLGGRTLLIDADMRTPRLHRLFDLNDDTGLSTLLSGRADGGLIQQVRELPSLYVIAVGPVPPNPLELIQRPAFGMLIQEMLNKFDYVLVDTPAGVYGADARVIATLCGAALVVGRKDKTRVDAVNGLLKKLENKRTVVAGVVMNEN